MLLAHFFLNIEKLYGETLYMYCRYYSEIMVLIISFSNITRKVKYLPLII